tara:strand:- start:108 stop:281 length:174 start_codon:yes stop_codon:yes gene_type:complete
LDLDLKKVIILLSVGIGLTPNIFSPYVNILFWSIAVLLAKKGDFWSYKFEKRRKGVK